MSTAKHTPGPWHATQWGKTVVIDAPEYLGLAHLNHIGNIMANGRPALAIDKANARLIAAAPEMLEALKALLWQHDNHGQLFGMALQDARATIAKAEGS